MRVLVACERYGRVRDAFRARGHDAWSADVAPCDSPWHRRQAIQHMEDLETFDLMIAFPPCTYLTNAGNGWPMTEERTEKKADAIAFVRWLADREIPRIAIENPVGALSNAWRKPDQIVHPFWFGDPYSKRTCLWLKGLSKLCQDNYVTPVGPWLSTSSNRLLGAGVRSEIRDLTFSGFARAMAEQWGEG